MSPLARTDERKRTTHGEPSMSAIYGRDFYSWCMHQALALKRAGSMKLDLPLALDWENLAEEVESMGREQEDKLESAYRVLLVHLLKWQYQPDQRSSSWRGSIVEQRKRCARPTCPRAA